MTTRGRPPHRRGGGARGRRRARCGRRRARITAVDEQGRTFIDDVGEGDLWNFPSVTPIFLSKRRQHGTPLMR
jgi:hypothetical protein